MRMFKFFGLREDPFRVSPDPRYLFLTPNTQKALVSLAYGLQSRSGILLMTGEVGTGKTTLLQKLLDWLHDNRAATAFLFNTRLSAIEFLYCMMADFGISCQSRTKSEIVIRLNHWLLARMRQGDLTVLIVDEAQNLSTEVLEEIRLLANLETSTEKLLQIVLSGQPELDEKLKQPELRQLRQRVVFRCHTMPLTLMETEGYIAKRLSMAGGNGEAVFSPEAIQCVHDYSRGIPRVINVLCQHAMINALADQKRPVPVRLVMEAVRDLELESERPEGSTPSLFVEHANGVGVGRARAVKSMAAPGPEGRA
jgi:general secretion pathway protein A